jgi:3-deoxy-D-arabino-heptulosonate 7-phosphate (DAHP) synthase
MKNLKLASREQKERTIVNVGDVEVGHGLVIIAGPCSVENEKQTIETALAVKAAGADMMRGGAFKPRTSPYAFQGLGLQGLKILEKAREETGLPIEVHNKPEEALCDADQALTPEMFSNVMSQVRPLKAFLENNVSTSSSS